MNQWDRQRRCCGRLMHGAAGAGRHWQHWRRGLLPTKQRALRPFRSLSSMKREMNSGDRWFRLMKCSNACTKTGFVSSPSVVVGRC